MLNRGGDAWAIPVQGTVGDGRAEGRSKRWRITVIWAGFGTDTSDDVCSSPDQVGERLFAATFHFNVQTSAGMPFTARASDFVLPDTSGRLYRTNAWADSLMFSLLRMKSGQSRDHYLSFRGLPKGENTYSLQLMQRNQRPVVIGTYHVVPNGKSPCPST